MQPLIPAPKTLPPLDTGKALDLIALHKDCFSLGQSRFGDTPLFGVYLVSISIGYERELGEWIDLIERRLKPVLIGLLKLHVDFH